LAKYIHTAEHHGDRDAIRAAVSEMDQLFHHVETDMVHWTSANHYYVPGGALPVKLQSIETVMHHLMNDVGVQPGSAGPATPPPPGGGAPPPPPGG
jgi:hypothetical protein